MIFDLVCGIASALAPLGCPVYTEDVEQGLSEPCFLITVLQHSATKTAPKAVRSRNQVQVSYLPAEGGDKGALWAMGEELTARLEVISLPNGDFLRGNGRNFSISEGILHFNINYDWTLRLPDDTPKMACSRVRVEKTER